MPETEAWTIGRLLAWTTDYLSSRRAETPRLDAELLLAHSRDCERIDLYTAFNEVVDEEVRTTFRELVRRRAEGVPVAYLLGRREFYSLDFHVTPDVLIPRPETEFVVVRLLDLARQQRIEQKPLNVVDVGTGSGILAICAARGLSAARVLAIDVSRPALSVANWNVRQFELEERVTLVAGDLLLPLGDDEPLDFVISNPPYVRSSEMSQLARDVVDHEPRVALEAGPQGTEVIERLIAQAAERLKVGGHLIMEISPMIQSAVMKLLAAESRLEPLATKKDLAGLARVVSARRKP